MSLYYDAAAILTDSRRQGSLKSRIYAKNAGLRSKPAHVYALISEAAKYDIFLKEVIDHAGLLEREPRLTPVLALLLVHDHFFAKGGIAARVSHPLRESVQRHKARLQAEFTKARIKRRIPTVEQLKATILRDRGTAGRVRPRWARVNVLGAPVGEHIKRHFGDYEAVSDLQKVMLAAKGEMLFHYDLNVPGLLAFPSEMDLTKHPAYTNGDVVLQDKASCFPAHLLADASTGSSVIGDVIDGCAAPGNKTTHLAALLAGTNSIIYACERDPLRSKILQAMIDKMHAGRMVKVLAKQDFLALDPRDDRFQNVTHLLLDPSCSGSGIIGREDVPTLALPEDPRSNRRGRPQQHDKTMSTNNRTMPAKKHRRTDSSPSLQHEEDMIASEREDEISSLDDLEQNPLETDSTRLQKLSNLQSLIVEHAFSFPAAARVTYSTCSIHAEENEAVVSRVLASEIAKTRGWRVLTRGEQVEGLRQWQRRGLRPTEPLREQRASLWDEEQSEACIRCDPDGEEGTMGFFVCGFVRDGCEGLTTGQEGDVNAGAGADTNTTIDGEENEEWEGFSDA